MVRQYERHRLTRRSFLTAALGLGLLACSRSAAPGPSPAPTSLTPAHASPATSVAPSAATPPPSPTRAASPTMTIATAPSAGVSPTPGLPTAPPSRGPVQVTVTTFLSNLEVPWDIAFAPDGRIFITERPGRLRVVIQNQLRPEPVATLSDVAATGEGGLLGLALDPDFTHNHYLYLYYTTRTANGALVNRVVRFTERDNHLTDQTVLLDGIPGAVLHNGGRIAFGPDGKLYITVGDARNPNAAQDLRSLSGKILRINPDGSIPSDNPFPNSPIWSYGHRNPQGLAWRPGTGQLYETEHGPSGEFGLYAHDELNLIEPGKNYGWPAYASDVQISGGIDAVPPLLDSGNQTWAPSGMTFVSHDRIPQWHGSLLFAGLRGEGLWRITLSADGRQVTGTEVLYQGQFGRLRTVVEGPDGTLSVLTNNRDGRGRPQQGDDRVLLIKPSGS